MRTCLSLEFLAYDNAEPTNDPADAIQIKRRVEEAATSEVSRQAQITVPNAAVDQLVNLPSNSTDYLILLTDQVISVKLNGSSDAQVLKPQAAGKKTPVLMLRGTISGLTVSNASGTAAKLDVIAVKI